MATLNELLQDYVNRPYDELLAFARLSLNDLVDDFKQIFDGPDGAAQACMVIVSACLGADGKVTALEHKFLNDLLGTNNDIASTQSMVSALGTSEARELTDQLADSLSNDKKSRLLMFCLSFMAVDETISRDEVAFVLKLIE